MGPSMDTRECHSNNIYNLSSFNLTLHCWQQDSAFRHMLWYKSPKGIGMSTAERTVGQLGKRVYPTWYYTPVLWGSDFLSCGV